MAFILLFINERKREMKKKAKKKDFCKKNFHSLAGNGKPTPHKKKKKKKFLLAHVKEKRYSSID